MLFVSFLILLVYSSFSINYIYLNRLTVLVIIYSLFLFINSINVVALTPGITLHNNWFNLSARHIPLIVLIYLIVIFILIYTTTRSRHSLDTSNFSLIVLANLIGLLMLPLSNDLISTYIIIELQSYSLYILCGLYNKSYNSTRAGMLYFLTGGAASTIILLGIHDIYALTGTTNIPEINVFFEYYDQDEDTSLLLFALLFKMGMAPFHQWSISVYNYTPTYITAYVSIVAKISIISFIYINYSLFDNHILTIIFYVSIIVAAIKPLYQTNIKTILAFSGLLNFGYLLLTVSVMDLAFYIYLIQYSLTHVVLFICLLAMGESENHPVNSWSPVIYLEQLKNKNKTLIFIMVIAVFSLIGIPPLPGFYGKYYILMSLIKENYIFETIIIIICSVISTYYYVNIIRVMITPVAQAQSSDQCMNPSIAFILAILFTGLISFSLFLPLFLEWFYLLII